MGKQSVASLNGKGKGVDAMTAADPIASESGHWYTREGLPAYTIVGKNGKERPTTLREARTMDLVPSVTSITRLLAAPGLTNWIIEQNIMAALTLPRLEGESDADFLKRVREDGKAKATKAAERGTALHTDIERAIQGKPHTKHQEHVKAVALKMQEYGMNLFEGKAEHSFSHPSGFGGKVDFHWPICDFKSKDIIEEGKKLVWDEHAMQLSAYRTGLQQGLLTDDRRCFNIFVGIDDCKVEIVQHAEEELERGWAMFSCLLKLWRLKNNI